jgi:hypothetical protein
MSARALLCLCSPVQVVALQRADPLSKESYQLSTRFRVSGLILNWNRPEVIMSDGRSRKRRRKQGVRGCE